MSKNIYITTLFLSALLLFAPSLTGAFLNLDDLRHIPNNPWLIQFDIPRFWREAYFYLYAPVVYSVWTVLYHVWASPVIFHALNVILHAGNVVFVFLVLRELDRSARTAFAAALIFGVHPLQVESVAWISAGRDQISAFFGLLTTWLYLSRSRVRRGASVLTFALGLLAKPGLAPLPLALWVLRRGSRLAVQAQLVMAILVLALTRAAQSSITGVRLPELAIWERALIAVDALGFYVRQIIWPLKLSADYARTPEFVLSSHAYVYGLLTIVAASAAAYFVHRRWKVALYKPLAFSVLLFLPVLGFVPFIAQIQSTVSDRYAYLPMFGMVMALTQLAPLSRSKPRWRNAAFLILIFVLASRTITRERVWHDDRRLFTSIVEAQPRSYLGAVNLANEEVISHHFDHARELLRTARDIHPELATASAGLAQVYWMTGERDKILGEIKPHLHDEAFLLRNAESTLDLSVMRLMVARAEAAQNQLDSAFDDYCAYARLNPQGEAMAQEITMFLRAINRTCAPASR